MLCYRIDSWSIFLYMSCFFISITPSSKFRKFSSTKVIIIKFRYIKTPLLRLELSKKTLIRPISSLILFRVDLFGAAHGWVGAKKTLLPNICYTYLTMMKLSTVIPYLTKIQKNYKLRDTPLEYC